MKEKLFEYLIQLIEFYKGQFQFDMNVFSEPWMYWPLCIPVVVYITFFIFKWSVLTLPLWMPFRMILIGFKGLVKFFVKGSKRVTK